MNKYFLLCIGVLALSFGCSGPMTDQFERSSGSIQEQSGIVTKSQSTEEWVNIPGSLKQISVGNANYVWGVNADNYIYNWNGSAWINVPGRLKYVSVGNDGQVWGINPNNVIYRRDGTNWTEIPGALIQISVGNAGNVWGINPNYAVYRWTGSGWSEVGGALKCVAIGNDSKVWGVNPNNVVYRRDGSNWVSISGSLVQISVGNANYVWGVDSSNAIKKWTGSSWEQVPGALKQVSVGNDGKVWGIDPNGAIYRRDSITITQAPTPEPTPEPNPSEILDVPFITQQGTGKNNCGPASLAMCIDAYGKRPAGFEDNSLFVNKVREQMKAPTGLLTSIDQMEYALNDKYKELPCTRFSTLQEVKDRVTIEKKPVIILVDALKLCPPPTVSTLPELGHFIVVRGYSSDGQSVIVNDPLLTYGETEYPYGCISDAFWNDALAVGDGLGTGPIPSSIRIVIDDGDTGFSLGGNLAYWYPATSSSYYYNHDMYWTYVNGSSVSNWATWTPNLPEAGKYKVEAWITWDNATTGSAQYTVSYSGGSITFFINQNIFSEQWVDLGSYYFNSGTGGYVKLTDATREDPNSLLKIGVDALRWTKQ